MSQQQPAKPHNDSSRPSFGRLNRRGFLAGTGLVGMSAMLAPAAQAQSSMGSLGSLDLGSSDLLGSSTPGGNPEKAPLKFKDGRFKIVQFNDTQDDHLTDRRTIEFMEKVLDDEKPGFALINGDAIAGGPKTTEQAFQAMNNVVLPMEERKIPWAITFGNHDEDSTEEDGTKATEAALLEFVLQYKYNLNVADDPVYGESNVCLPVADSSGKTTKFGIWLLDSGRYIGDELAGQPTYDYIRPDQIQWYRSRSEELEKQAGQKVYGLMFFHIPTFEHRDMWFGGPYNNDAIKHGQAVKRHGIKGVKNEDVYVGAFNSGIYAAVRERGDVLGIYCGHDHINSFNGNYFGVELGYCPGTGFAPYGLHDGTWDQNTLRGARVFELNEASEWVYESTRLIFAKDLGIDMNPKKQPIEKPRAFPEYIHNV